ncbi:hypothetical protein D3C80_1718600 [compost metagenome]
MQSKLGEHILQRKPCINIMVHPDESLVLMVDIVHAIGESRSRYNVVPKLVLID